MFLPLNQLGTQKDCLMKVLKPPAASNKGLSPALNCIDNKFQANLMEV